MHNKPKRLFPVIISALFFLALLSICPWETWTNGKLKDFSLVSGVKQPTEQVNDSIVSDVDPELLALQQETGSNSSGETVTTDNASQEPVAVEIEETFKAPRRDKTVLIEDYSKNGNGLATIKSKLAQASSRNVRIAMVGDSYIEGDILAQDLRSGLQDMYGGSGVGYVGAFSQFPGFRRSVIQTTSGWNESEIRKMSTTDNLRTILGHYHTSKSGEASTRFKGTNKIQHADSWNRTLVLFTAPVAGTVSLADGSGVVASRQVQPSDSLQSLVYEGTTGDIKLKTDIAGLKVLGMWLEGKNGIVLDDISLRGNSGISHRKLNESTTKSMRRFVDYDLIILEFGLNVVTESQRNYSAYGKGMVNVIENLKRLYPNAQILVMGVGDRGTKSGGEVISLPTLGALVKAQREAAAATGSMFFDTREAMGGNGAALDWNERKLLNSDFVHLNHKGGKVMADILLKSLKTSIQ